MKSDQVQRTEAVSWTIRTRSQVGVRKDFMKVAAKSGLADSRALRPVPLHVCYASPYKQKVYRSAYSSTCTRALRTLVTGTELAEFRHMTCMHTPIINYWATGMCTKSTYYILPLSVAVADN